MSDIVCDDFVKAILEVMLLYYVCGYLLVYKVIEMK